MHARSHHPFCRDWLLVVAATAGLAAQAAAVQGQDAPGASRDSTAQNLAALVPNVLPQDDPSRRRTAGMLRADVQARLREANRRENAAWSAVQSQGDWERFREPRIAALRTALGHWPDPPARIDAHVTRVLEGDGYQLKNLVFESRPGLWVTGNLYVPAKPADSMPAILLSHSHHAPKTQGELQEMGATWARAGCLVLVPDHVGHGQRRQHPFVRQQDYPGSFRVGRQDYYFRYITGIQLAVAGDSLMGWMVWDLMRAVDVLLAQPGADPARLILLGGVAGGGDPAGVTAALDARVKAVVPFNFGGPQPDYAIPENALDDFYYFGVAYWESTRCLRLGARDGFAHWVIVAAAAPRALVYSHEFAWDRQRDPVWPRIEQVYRWYDAEDRLAAAFGQGTLQGQPPESSHCGNIGALHRSRFYPALERWFTMPIPQEVAPRHSADELACLPLPGEQARSRLVHELASEAAAARSAPARRQRASLPPDEQAAELRKTWAERLGSVTLPAEFEALPAGQDRRGDTVSERLVLEPQPEIVVPLVLLRRPAAEGRRPVVVMVAQRGKQAFVEQRAEVIERLLDGGVHVCLVDVRGTGETEAAIGSRQLRGSATSLGAIEALLGETLLAGQLRDLLATLRYLRGRPDVDPARLAVWGDSFAPINAADANVAVPLDAPLPHVSEPAGGLLALLVGLFDHRVRAAYSSGSLVSYASLLDTPFCYVPHDALVPGAAEIGDLTDVVAAIAPRAVRIDRPVDGCNRAATRQRLTAAYESAAASYRGHQAETSLALSHEHDPAAAADWVLEQLR